MRRACLRPLSLLAIVVGFLLAISLATSSAQQPGAAPATPIAPGLSINIGGTEQGNVSSAIQIVLLMTVLTLAPSILLLMTSFTRIVGSSRVDLQACKLEYSIVSPK